ncbi:hypothetical protein ABZU45_11980 [Streptomyces avermitilis]|uniref:hypothetical protein n=1 Tax=Streptomyces avermitilis TaxID=33903 RepID=UPI0033BEAE86
MISPEKIPTFTGDLIELQREIISLRRAAKAIREHGGDVHTRFQRLDASYRAPEAEQLFATTQAVQDGSGDFGDQLDSVAGALETYTVEVAQIVAQLESLRGAATAFVESVKGDDGMFSSWRKDADKVAEHQALWDGVNAAIAAFQRAEVDCADTITALVGGTQWHIDDGSPKQKNAYGFSAKQLGQAASLPWGSPEHQESLPFGIDYHLEQSGISIWDNAKGSVEGLIDLFSPGEEGTATREGLTKVFIGISGYLLNPRGDRETHLGPVADGLMEESKPYTKAFAKSFVGWDDWSTNPGKAAGTVIFNGLTLGAGPLGAASRAGSVAGEASAAARVAGTLAKVGEALDPIGAAAKTVGAAARVLPKVSELTAGVRAATEAAAHVDTAHSVLRLSDGSELRIRDGEFIPGKSGVIDNTPAAHEPAAPDRLPAVESPRPRELVGAGARTGEASADAGGSLPPQAGQEATYGGHSGGDVHHSSARDVPESGAGGGQGAGSGHSDGGVHGSAEGLHHGGSHPDSDGGAPSETHADPLHGDHGAHGSEGPGLPNEDHPIRDHDASGGPPDIDPSKYSKNANDFAQSPTGRIEPEQEAAVLSELDRVRMDARDQASVLRSLRKDPYGSGIAEMISRGHLRDVEGYEKLLDMCKQGPTKADPKGMVPAAYMAMQLATDLQGQGIGRVGVELDTVTFDLDVYTRHPDGAVDYGYQLKDVTNITGIKGAARKAAKQLAHDGLSHRVAILDVHQPIGNLTPKMFDEAEFQARKSGATFLLRFSDGSITVPPNGPTFP